MVGVVEDAVHEAAMALEEGVGEGEEWISETWMSASAGKTRPGRRALAQEGAVGVAFMAVAAKGVVEAALYDEAGGGDNAVDIDDEEAAK